MKTVLYSFMMLISSLLCLESVRAENEPQPPTEILITNTELSNSSNKPRTLIQDIEAYHSNNMVYFTFNENLGQANIVITNSNSGAQVETSVPANCSNVQVDISRLGQGDFTILIYAGDTIYTGSFTL